MVYFRIDAGNYGIARVRVGIVGDFGHGGLTYGTVSFGVVQDSAHDCSQGACAIANIRLNVPQP